MSELDIVEVAPEGSAATTHDLEVLEDQLGRLPRGVWAVGARCVCSNPLVVVTKPQLEDGTPFPTLFYLASPVLTKAVSTLEAEHLMEQLNNDLAADPDVQEQYKAAHHDYLRRRELLGEVEQIAGISAGGMPTRVKCLHALVAHSLSVGPGVNPIGDYALQVLAERQMWESSRCHCGQ